MRPIDADALKAKAFGDRKGLIHTADVDDAPTVDAVPVVRCKDCKYFIQTVFFGNKMNACRRHGSSITLPTARIVADDWFCADGERWKE